MISVKESMRGATDREVLERAQQENRLVVTFDKDFGELAYRFKLPATSGVILFRLSYFRFPSIRRPFTTATSPVTFPSAPRTNSTPPSTTL